MKRVFAKSASGLLAKTVHLLIRELNAMEKFIFVSKEILQTSKDVKLKNCVNNLTKGELSFTFIPLAIKRVLGLKNVYFVIKASKGEKQFVKVSDEEIGGVKNVSMFLYDMVEEIILKDNPDEKYIYNQSSKCISIGGVVKSLKKAEFDKIEFGFIIENDNKSIKTQVFAKAKI